MFVHGVGNTFQGDATAAEQVAPRHGARGRKAARLFALHMDLAIRVSIMRAAGDLDAADKLDAWLTSVTHCGNVPAR